MRRKIPVAAGALCVALLVVAGAASADPLVSPPAGAPLLLEVVADGVQIYACEAKGEKSEWVFKRPDAWLFDSQGRQVGTHFAGPTWKLSDGSAVVGEVASRADAPAAGAVPWLLLRVKAHENSQGSDGALAKAAFVRRAETRGGVAPTEGCHGGTRGTEVRMRYSALYQFYGAAP